MNVEIGTEAGQLLFREYINGIFVAVQNRLDDCDCVPTIFLCLTLGNYFWTFLIIAIMIQYKQCALTLALIHYKTNGMIFQKDCLMRVYARGAGGGTNSFNKFSFFTKYYSLC
jgi:hypothetical protein